MSASRGAHTEIRDRSDQLVGFGFCRASERRDWSHQRLGESPHDTGGTDLN
jgi:hypothetical protein